MTAAVEPMRVLALTSWYPPHHYGGYELSCHDVLTRLDEKGHEVGVLCSDQRIATVDRMEDALPLQVRRELRLYIDDGDLLEPSLGASIGIERANRAALEQALEETRPDVVFVWQVGALSLGLLTHVHALGLPVVYAVCDDWLLYAEQLDAWTRRWQGSLARRALGRMIGRATSLPTDAPDWTAPATWCFVSDHVRRRAEDHLGRTLPRATVVHSGINTKDFPLQSPTSPPWRGNIVYAGRLDPRKGIDTLVEAVAGMPDTRLSIHARATADERQRLNVLIAELDLAHRVTVQESARADLARHFAEADVVVFPSEWDEPFGLVPVEAMASATPVIATGTGGSGDFLFHDENCLLFEPGNSSELQAAIARMADDDALRDRLRAGGLVTARQLTSDRLADTFEEWLRATVDGFRDGQPSHRTAPRPSEPTQGGFPRAVDGAGAAGAQP